MKKTRGEKNQIVYLENLLEQQRKLNKHLLDELSMSRANAHPLVVSQVNPSASQDVLSDALAEDLFPSSNEVFVDLLPDSSFPPPRDKRRRRVTIDVDVDCGKLDTGFLFSLPSPSPLARACKQLMQGDTSTTNSASECLKFWLAERDNITLNEIMT